MLHHQANTLVPIIAVLLTILLFLSSHIVTAITVVSDAASATAGIYKITITLDSSPWTALPTKNLDSSDYFLEIHNTFFTTTQNIICTLDPVNPTVTWPIANVSLVHQPDDVGSFRHTFFLRYSSGNDTGYHMNANTTDIPHFKTAMQSVFPTSPFTNSAFHLHAISTECVNPLHPTLLHWRAHYQ